MDGRYDRCFPSLSREEWETLQKSRVLVAGCGGLGGYVIEFLVRLGVGCITAADGDVFEASNLNRQILSDTSHIGKMKALTAAERAAAVNPDVKVIPVCEFLTAENADRLLSGQDIAVDALDDIPARRILADACTKAGIMMVHGGIAGWNVQVSVIAPDSGTLDRIFKKNAPVPDKTSLSFTPAFCASVQAAETVKILCGGRSELENRLFTADMKYGVMRTFDL